MKIWFGGNCDIFGVGGWVRGLGNFVTQIVTRRRVGGWVWEICDVCHKERGEQLPRDEGSLNPGLVSQKS